MPRGVNIIGPLRSTLGLGESARRVQEAFLQGDIPHSIVYETHMHGIPRHYPVLEGISLGYHHDVSLYCIHPALLPSFIASQGWKTCKKKYTIGFLYWETDTLSPEAIRGLEYLNEVWVASTYLKEVFSRSTSLPVTILPFPQPLLPLPPPRQKGTPYTFLYIFDYFSVISRKNPQAAILAFQHAFPRERADVKLILKTSNVEHHATQQAELRQLARGDERIIFIDTILNGADLIQLMASCDCYLSPHRAEGLGLTLLEAMSLGKPVIATGYSANCDFMNTENSLLCSYELIDVGNNIACYAGHGRWADISLNDLSQKMAWVAHHPDEAAQIGEKGRQTIAHNHRTEDLAQAITERLALLPASIPTKRKPRAILKHQLLRLLNRFRSSQKEKIDKATG